MDLLYLNWRIREVLMPRIIYAVMNKEGEVMKYCKSYSDADKEARKLCNVHDEYKAVQWVERMKDGL
jgi:hypothetical protein